MGVMSILQWEDQLGVRDLGRSAHSFGILSRHLHISQIIDNYRFFLLFTVDRNLLSRFVVRFEVSFKIDETPVSAPKFLSLLDFLF